MWEKPAACTLHHGTVHSTTSSRQLLWQKLPCFDFFFWGGGEGWKSTSSFPPEKKAATVKVSAVIFSPFFLSRSPLLFLGCKEPKDANSEWRGQMSTAPPSYNSISIVRLLFLSAAKPRPWNSRCCCCCCWSSWGDYFGFRYIFSRYRNLYKISLVDHNDVKNCANFQPIVTSTFAKKAKNDFAIFFKFAVFLLFDLPNDLKIQIWPHPPDIIWGCPIFLIL